MDRRERYDPEDIETLMQERSFDELLEEERAYVLRHVSDRAEYEAMRALLLHLRDTPQDHGPIEADPAIRGKVMQAFRAQQQPEWRIWLNSVRAWLVPENAFALWRPALAFASLALVIGTAVILMQQVPDPTAELAEIRPKRDASEPKLGVPERELPNEEQNRAEPDVNESGPELQQSAPSASSSIELKDAVDTEIGYIAEEKSTMSSAEIAFESEFSDYVQVKARSEYAEEAMDSMIQQSSHMVSKEELHRNMSTVNATGRVSAKAAARADAERSQGTKGSMAENVQLFELLATGW